MTSKPRTLEITVCMWQQHAAGVRPASLNDHHKDARIPVFKLFQELPPIPRTAPPPETFAPISNPTTPTLQNTPPSAPPASGPSSGVIAAIAGGIAVQVILAAVVIACTVKRRRRRRRAPHNPKTTLQVCLSPHWQSVSSRDVFRISCRITSFFNGQIFIQPHL